MNDPFYRGRRLRMTPAMRNFTQETWLSPKDLIAPFFIVPGQKKEIPVESMPGVNRYSPDLMAAQVEKVGKLGIPAILLFGVLEEGNKNSSGSVSADKNGPVQTAIREIKKSVPDLVVITDVCLCGYTDHGHCGVLDKNGKVENDASLPVLAQMALSHVEAGADMVAPSDMMDGRVQSIRHLLNETGFSNTPILSYAAKYASTYYGPFRDAAKSGMKSGEKSRKSYQMNPANVREALLEIESDLTEGADMVMVKPALAYLDVIRAVRDRFDVPLVAYSVSGEYSMIKAAAEKGWVNEQEIVLETLTAIKRAGADKIITYFASEIASTL